MSLRKRHSAKVRWGYLREIDGRIRVGTKTWEGMPLRLRHLTSWRYMHKLSSGGKSGDVHIPVRMYGTRHRVRPSSNLPLKSTQGKASKLAYIAKKKK